jgi:AcrR family transcriptional regulator
MLYTQRVYQVSGYWPVRRARLRARRLSTASGQVGPEVETPTRMTGAQRKQLIVEVTIELVAEFGVEGTTTARIAAKAGVSEKTLYSHFASRKDILLAALDAVFERARDDLRHLAGANVLEHLRAAARRHGARGKEFVYPLFEFFAAPPTAGLREEVRIRHQTSIDIITGMIDEGKAQGLIRPDVDSELVAWEFFGVYWAEDVAFMIGFEEFSASRRPVIMMERILRDIAT